MATIGSLLAYIGVDTKGLDKGLAHSEKAMKTSTKKMGDSLRTLKRVAVAAFAGWGVKRLAESFIEAGIAMDAMNKSMAAAMGSAEDAAMAQTWLRQESERLGLVFQDQVKDFIKLAAAARGTNLEGQKTIEIYQAVAEASTALHLSSEETSGALTAINQIMSKGKVQAEELRGQLGERLPGAFQLAAKAMEMTTAELSKALEMGEVYADDFLPKFAKALKERYADAAVESSKSAQAALNRLINAWYSLRTKVMESGVLEVFTSMVTAITDTINVNATAISIFVLSAFKTMISAAKVIVETFYKIRSTFGEIVVAHAVIRLDVLNKKFLDVLEKLKKAKELEREEGAGVRTSKSIKYEMELDRINKKREEYNLLIKAGTMQTEEEQQKISGVIDMLDTMIDKVKLVQPISTEVLPSMFGGSDQGEEEDPYGAHVDKMAKKDAEYMDFWQLQQQEKYEVLSRAYQYEIDLENSKAKIQKQVARGMVANWSAAFAEFGRHSKVAFRIWQGIQIAEAVAATAKNAVTAWGMGMAAGGPFGGPALAAAYAASAIAFGAAQIASILSASPSGGSTSSGTSGGVISGTEGGGADYTMPETGITEDDYEKKRDLTIIFEGDVRIEDEAYIEELAEKINEAVEDREVTLIASRAKFAEGLA